MQSAKQFLDAAGVRVRFDFPNELPTTALPGKVRHFVFQAVREALNNAAKHARADLVRVELKVEAASLRVVIEDNGGGFVAEQAGAVGTHEGLEGMRRRMEEIGGQFALRSRPGGGTRIDFWAPLSG
jgi:signal transduction histidine kinase